MVKKNLCVFMPHSVQNNTLLG